MQLIRNLFPKLRMAARGSVIKVIGDESETAIFEKRIHELEDYCVKYNSLSEDAIIDIIHGEKADDAAQSGNALFFLRVAYGYGHRKDNGQIIVDGISHGLQQIEEEPDILIAEDGKCVYNILCGEGGADACQDTCDRQDHDRSHQHFA